MRELKGKKVLVTGGTGSFGNAIVKGFLKAGVDEVRIFSRDEKKQHDMRSQVNNDMVKFYIGDVRDYNSVLDAVKGIDIIFQAAALKQVPSCEFFPMQAVQTNIIGSDNVLKAGVESNVKSIICLSTDKAAYPINAMGISKAMMEKVAISHARKQSETKICITRYGNVMASRGSVIPLFIEQIKNNKPITITNPNMTRYLMSLDDAVDLVIFAHQKGSNGDLLVQKSPGCTIGDLAQAISNIFGVKLKTNFIGIRHGEKMYETLCTSEEMMKSDDLGEFYRVPMDARDLNYSKYFSDGLETNKNVSEYNSNNTVRLTVSEIESKLLSIDYVKNML